MRLVHQRQAVWQNRAQFFALAAEIMRRILVDRAQARQAAKRSGLLSRVTLTPDLAAAAPAVDVTAGTLASCHASTSWGA